MRVSLRAGVMGTIAAHMAAQPGREVCGMLVGAWITRRGMPGRAGVIARIEQAVPCANLAAWPTVSFLIDPVHQLRLQRQLRQSTSATILGCYHSHPGGRADPSPIDHQEARAQPGWIWLIAGGAGFTAWRAGPNGLSPLCIAVLPRRA